MTWVKVHLITALHINVDDLEKSSSNNNTTHWEDDLEKVHHKIAQFWDQQMT